ncbi:putative eka-like protein [Erysiphe necator]|uniref:Putative eka-like protein n=1 Tax=Uncinula necator TaxID=52586 RepID=A0A0B1PFV3_UNCNE|nr:putative eka-like protein [Erysiphe necator]
MSLYQSPIPPIPPISLNSQSLCTFATTHPPPSSTIPATFILENKPIVKPVPPSKIATQRDAEPESRNEENSSHLYLPRELENIIATRHRQERAWHIRLSICACIYSNIDSTLAIYKKYIEKEGADIFRKNLQKATAFLDTSDNLAQPPKIPIELKPGKKKFSNSPSNAGLNDLLANLKPPNLPSQNFIKNLEKQVVPLKQKENKQAMVGRNGHKNSRTIEPVATSSIATGTRHQPYS